MEVFDGAPSKSSRRALGEGRRPKVKGLFPKEKTTYESSHVPTYLREKHPKIRIESDGITRHYLVKFVPLRSHPVVLSKCRLMRVNDY